jgi:hypothetical protein
MANIPFSHLNRVITRFRSEILSLLVDIKEHLGEADAIDAETATTEEILASQEIHRAVVRVSDLIEWMHAMHAWSAREDAAPETFDPANRLKFRHFCLQRTDFSGLDLTVQAKVLFRRSLELYERACRMEDMILNHDDLPASAPGTTASHSTAA